MSKKKKTPQAGRKAEHAHNPAGGLLCRRHQRFGWWSLLFFLALGAVLETLHGLKVGWYVDVSSQTRRLMWTLAHAHGTLLSLIDIVFGLCLYQLPQSGARWPHVASACLLGATILLPLGFFLGGLIIYAGDPGIGILLVPIGAVLLIVGVFLAARHLPRLGSTR